MIKLLESEGWTKADAIRALEAVDFNQDPDELAIRRVTSLFAGSELNKRQRLQAAQKGMVTRKTKEIEWKAQENSDLASKAKMLAAQQSELMEANDQLKKDNKDLKNLVDKIKLKLALDMKKLLQYEDSEIRKALIKWFKGTQG
jgi:predicted RNase H-like nuclease (RuvC/YqgF family)